LCGAYDRQKKRLSAKTKADNTPRLTLVRTSRALHQHSEPLKGFKHESDTLYAENTASGLPVLDRQHHPLSVLGQHPFIAELLRFEQNHPNGRRYSPELHDFAYELHPISPKAEAFSRGKLPVPSITSIEHRYHAGTVQLVSVASCLKTQDEESLSEYAQEYRS
jgi:hypothetical protein